jgi:hypothetical protein
VHVKATFTGLLRMPPGVVDPGFQMVEGAGAGTSKPAPAPTATVTATAAPLRLKHPATAADDAEVVSARDHFIADMVSGSLLAPVAVTSQLPVTRRPRAGPQWVIVPNVTSPVQMVCQPIPCPSSIAETMWLPPS